MKDSDEEYEKWMKELEIEWDKRIQNQESADISSCDLINKCLFVSLVGLGKIHHENFPNFIRAVGHYS